MPVNPPPVPKAPAPAMQNQQPYRPEGNRGERPEQKQEQHQEKKQDVKKDGKQDKEKRDHE